MLTTTPDHYSSHHPNHYSLQLHPTQQPSVLWAVQVAPRSPRSAGAIAPGSFHLGEILILSQLEEAESHFQPQAPGHSVQLFSPARKAWCPSVFGELRYGPLEACQLPRRPWLKVGFRLLKLQTSEDYFLEEAPQLKKDSSVRLQNTILWF